MLTVLFLVSWGAQAVAEYQVFTDDQREHGQEAEPGDFAATFAQSTFENWQSEFLQLFTFVVLTAFLIHAGSAESKDGEDEVRQALARIERRLAELDPPGPTTS